MLAQVLAVVVCLCVCLCVCHTPVLYRNGCTDRADFFACRFPSIHAALCFKEIKGTSFWNFVPNSGLREFRHGTLTVIGECDINSDSERALVLTAPGGRRGECGLQSTTDRRLLIALDVKLCIRAEFRGAEDPGPRPPTREGPPTKLLIFYFLLMNQLMTSL